MRAGIDSRGAGAQHRCKAAHKTVCPPLSVRWLALHCGCEGCSDEPNLTAGGRAVAGHREAFVGIDVATLRNAIAIAEAGRGGEVNSSAKLKHRLPAYAGIERIAVRFDQAISATTQA